MTPPPAVSQHAPEAAPTAIAVIPARYASMRFPGKPLADRTGKPLIQHVHETVARARRIRRVVVATDDQRIFDAVARFGGEAVMTGEHPNGTSRIAEAIDKLYPPSAGGAPDVIVNVQGDEPEIDPAVIDALVDALQHDAGAPMATVASPLPEDGDEAKDPNVVKVVVDRRGRALYFSRAPIPHHRDPDPPTPGGSAPSHLRHLGLYAYRRAFLPTYLALPATPLELAEKLEQLRVLEHGHPIAVVLTPTSHPGIDTPEQYEAFVQRQARRSGDAS